MKPWLALSAALAAALPGALAADWSLEPFLEGQVGYDDNIRLLSSDVPGDQDAIVTEVTGQARLARETETSEIALIGGVNLVDYSEYDGIGELESEDNYFGAFYARRDRERSNYGIAADIRSDESLRNIRGIDDPVGSDPGNLPPPSDINDPDAGTIPVQTRRVRANVNPFYTMDLSERTELRIDGRYSFLRNDEVEGLDFQDSQEYGGGLRLRRAVTLRTGVYTQAGWRRFDPDDLEEIDIYDALLGVEFQLTPRFNVMMEAGANYSDSDEEGDDQGWLARVRGRRDFERGFLRGELSHELVPNSFGRLIEIDLASLLYRTNFSERWGADIRSNLSRTENRNAANTFDNRDYFDVEGELRWAATRRLSIAASYLYRYIDRETQAGGSASANVYTLSLTYRPPAPF